MQQAKDKLRPVPDLHYIFLSHMLNNLSTTLSFHKFHPHLPRSTNKNHLSYLPPIIHLHAVLHSTPLLQHAKLPHLKTSSTKHTHPVFPLLIYSFHSNRVIQSVNHHCLHLATSPHFNCKNHTVLASPSTLHCLFHQISLSSRALMNHSVFKGICSIIQYWD